MCNALHMLLCSAMGRLTVSHAQHLALLACTWIFLEGQCPWCMPAVSGVPSQCARLFDRLWHACSIKVPATAIPTPSRPCCLPLGGSWGWSWCSSWLGCLRRPWWPHWAFPMATSAGRLFCREFSALGGSGVMPGWLCSLDPTPS